MFCDSSYYGRVNLIYDLFEVLLDLSIVFVMVISVLVVVFVFLFCNLFLMVLLSSWFIVFDVRLVVFGGLEVILNVVMVNELNLLMIIM